MHTKSENDKNTLSLATLLHPQEYYFNARSIQLEKINEQERMTFLGLRVLSLILLVILLTIHIKYMRVFRWEQSVTGGVLVTYFIAIVGLIFCTGCYRCRCRALQAYFLSTGAALLVANAAGLWRRWREADELTRAVAELLVVLGVSLRKQVIIKVWLSATAGLCLLVDLCLLPILGYLKYAD